VRLARPTHLVALCHSQQQAGHIKARLAKWLAPRGLALTPNLYATTGSAPTHRWRAYNGGYLRAITD